MSPLAHVVDRPLEWTSPFLRIAHHVLCGMVSVASCRPGPLCTYDCSTLRFEGFCTFAAVAFLTLGLGLPLLRQEEGRGPRLLPLYALLTQLLRRTIAVHSSESSSGSSRPSSRRCCSPRRRLSRPTPGCHVRALLAIVIKSGVESQASNTPRQHRFGYTIPMKSYCKRSVQALKLPSAYDKR